MQRVVTDTSTGRLVSWRVPGASPAVVCVHGAGVSSRQFLPLLLELHGVRETWSVDLPGFGASSGPAQPLGLPALADALVEWLDVVLGEPVLLLGCSFGSQIAVETVLRHPDRIRGLVLIGLTADPVARSRPRQFGRWLRNSVSEPGQLAALSYRDYRDAGIRLVLATMSESLRDRVEDKLPHVDVPAMVVRGEHDRLVPQPWAEESTRLLPQGRLAVIGGAAHTVPVAQPARCAEVVDRFVTEVQP
jgi:pimeloyl-ACP methyl ester carboxylesterase